MVNETETRAVSVESRTIQKLRTRIIPFIFILYVIAFIDRINIGFAALTMNKELGITDQQFGLLSGIFFIGYFLFEIPSNQLLHKVGARIWIARILVSWGLIGALTGLVQSLHQLYVARFLLGLAEPRGRLSISPREWPKRCQTKHPNQRSGAWSCVDPANSIDNAEIKVQDIWQLAVTRLLKGQRNQPK